MFLSKIRRRESGILLYGITPPKVHTPEDKIIAAAARTVSNLSEYDIDALVVYDVQDESARTNEERPFPFVNAIDPFDFASRHLVPLVLPKIIYRPAGKYTATELKKWLHSVKAEGFFPVFVGVPSPDYPVKTSLTEAYSIWQQVAGTDSAIGGVMIPERHAVLNDEQARILDKTRCGVSFFISQCVFEVNYAKRVLQDLVAACAQQNTPVPTMVFTLTICGSEKTLQFMEWLGIYVPENIKSELRASDSQVERSVKIAADIAAELVRFCQENAIPFGFNIESVAIRKEEIDASLKLLAIVNGMLMRSGARKPMVTNTF